MSAVAWVLGEGLPALASAPQASPPAKDGLDAAHALRFILAGNARVTLVSRRTGARFTFRVRVSRDNPLIHFVAVMNGPNNEEDFAYLGTIFSQPQGTRTYRHGMKSRIASTAPSAVAFAWAFGKLARGTSPEELEVHHEGRCGRCGRVLTTPESISTGIGPVCGGR